MPSLREILDEEKNPEILLLDLENEAHTFSQALTEENCTAAIGLDKYWDVIAYGISPERRTTYAEKQWLHQYNTASAWTVFGHHIGPKYEGMETDAPCRYNTPQDVEMISNHIKKIDIDEYAEALLSIGEEAKTKIYRGSSLSSKADVSVYVKILETLSLFYMIAAKHKQGTVHLLL